MKTITKIGILLFAILINFQLYAQTENLAVIAAKMNVFYFGIDNPVSVAVPGYSNEDINVSITNGTIKGSDGKYTVTVSGGTETIINVTAKTGTGEIKVGCDTFKIKKVPDPIPCIGNYCTSKISCTKEELLKNPEITVSLTLPFDLKFEVASFTFSYFPNKETLSEKNVTGNKFSKDIIDIIHKMEIGNKFYHENIKSKGPDGTARTLAAMIVTIK